MPPDPAPGAVLFTTTLETPVPSDTPSGEAMTPERLAYIKAQAGQYPSTMARMAHECALEIERLRDQLQAATTAATTETRDRQAQEQRTIRATDELRRLVRVIATASGDPAAARLMRVEAEGAAYCLLRREDGERLVQAMAAARTAAETALAEAAAEREEFTVALGQRGIVAATGQRLSARVLEEIDYLDQRRIAAEDQLRAAREGTPGPGGGG